jgi:RNA-binding protein
MAKQKALTPDQLKYLKGMTHHINPVVMVASKGLTENVMMEIERALNHHELVKIRLRTDRDTRDAFIEQILLATGAERINVIGQTLCLYRRHPEQPVIALP